MIVEAVLDGTMMRQTDSDETVEVNAVLEEGWMIGQAYLESQKVQTEETCVAENDWPAQYEDAMFAKGLEKGWLL